jgi:DNA repair exonuclease SbcCD ATPase subunit
LYLQIKVLNSTIDNLTNDNNNKEIEIKNLNNNLDELNSQFNEIIEEKVALKTALENKLKINDDDDNFNKKYENLQSDFKLLQIEKENLENDFNEFKNNKLNEIIKEKENLKKENQILINKNNELNEKINQLSKIKSFNNNENKII